VSRVRKVSGIPDPKRTPPGMEDWTNDMLLMKRHCDDYLFRIRQLMFDGRNGDMDAKHELQHRFGLRLLCLAFALALGWLAPALSFGASATLAWTDNSNNEMGFNIERKQEACAGVAGTWAPLGTTGAGVATYVDTNVISGNTYCYRVNAWNTTDGTPTGPKQYSAWSNTAGATIPFGQPAQPTGLGVVVTP